MTNNIDNRKWALEQAVLSGAKEPVKTAHDFLKFINGNDTLTTKARQEEEDNRGEIEREWSAKTLNDAKKRVMMNVISRFQRDMPINGVKIAGDLEMTQSNASAHLAWLVKEGYVGRQGNKFWPLRTITGKLLPVIVHKMPKGVAKGYQGQMKAPLGEIAKVTHG